MKKLVTVLAVVLTVTVVVQFFLAAMGAFDSAPAEEAFAPHRALGNVILLLALVVALVAAVARMPARVAGTAGLVAALVLLQSVIKEVAGAVGDDSGALLFGVHGVNGMLIVGTVGALLRQAREQSAAPRPVS
ncbi:DUF6220 domain-containing protein [Nocardia asteroides]|uniref:DUF6220 domain-containing protein n=1 Tax=Nocardia asteroides TaxID=1824 RepID=UPI00340F4506